MNSKKGSNSMYNYLSFNPMTGLSSPHMQTIMPRFISHGSPPPSENWIVHLKDEDHLFCKLSTPENWKENAPTIVLIHGLGGNHHSGYMVRFSRKLFQNGYRVLCLNLRGSGEGENQTSKPYNAGNSWDVKEALEKLKQEHPDSLIKLIGFSLGGNIALKLAGELDEDSKGLVDEVFAVCPPVDLAHTVTLLSQGFNKIYHRYYLHYLSKQTQKWLKGRHIGSLLEYDEIITAPQWGFKDAADYYQKSSSYKFIPKITLSCNILYSGDDPIIDYRLLNDVSVPSNVHVWVSSHGGHMGFMSRNESDEGYHWMDKTLLKWLKGDFT